jgi:PASTA domain
VADPAGGTDFLKRKLGPFPVWVYIVALGLVVYVFRSKLAGLTGSGAAATAATVTDPAGNTCAAVDPETGYCPGTSQDTAALQAASTAATATPTTTSTGVAGGIASGTSTYSDNNAWGVAAISYLQTVGIDGTDATNAIENYLNGVANTTAYQNDVNIAISALGPPPTVPPTAVNTSGGTSGAAGAGTCATGFTWSSTQTGASGEVPATNGSGWCEPSPAVSGTPPAATVTVPKVEGDQVDEAESTLTAAGLTAHLSSARKSGTAYWVASQTPAAGKKVNKGSTVDLGITTTKPK